MPTPTTNFSFNKPLVNDAIDEDIWGGQLNDNWDSIDGILPVPAASKFGALAVQSTDDASFEILSGQGTSGQVLTSNGADALPSFQTFGAGWVKLETIIASNQSSVDFDSGNIDSNFRTYIFQITNCVFAADSAGFRMLGSTDTGSTYLTATDSYKYHNTIKTSNTGTGSSVFSDNDGTTFINLLTGWGNVTNEGLSGTIFLSNPSNAAIFKHVYGTVTGIDSGGNSRGCGIFSSIQTTSAVNATRFLTNSANILSGTFELFGA